MASPIPLIYLLNAIKQAGVLPYSSLTAGARQHWDAGAEKEMTDALKKLPLVQALLPPLSQTMPGGGPGGNRITMPFNSKLLDQVASLAGIHGEARSFSVPPLRRVELPVSIAPGARDFKPKVLR